MAQPHPLALLGDVIAGAGAQYAANQQRRQSREEQLADIAAERAFQQEREREHRRYQEGQAREERAFQTEFRKGGWDQEAKLYETRRFDAVKNHLMEAGYLAPADLTGPAAPEAFRIALEKGGVEFRENSEELAKDKAAIQTIIDRTEGNPEAVARLSRLLDMKPGDIVEARNIMKEAYALVGQTVDKKTKDEEANKNNGAMMMATHIAKIGEIDSKRNQMNAEIERLTTGRYSKAEEDAIRNAGKAMLDTDQQEEIDTGAPSQETLNALAATRAKAIEEVINPRIYSLTSREKSLANEAVRGHGLLDSVSLAVSKGIAGRMDPKLFGIGKEEAPPPAEKPPPRSAAERLGGFDDIIKPKPAPVEPRGPVAGPPLPVEWDTQLRNAELPAYAQPPAPAVPAGISPAAAAPPPWLPKVPFRVEPAPAAPPTAFAPGFIERLGTAIGGGNRMFNPMPAPPAVVAPPVPMAAAVASARPRSVETERLIQQPIDNEFERIRSLYADKVVDPAAVKNLQRNSLQNLLQTGRFVTPLEKEVAQRRVQQLLNEPALPAGL